MSTSSWTKETFEAVCNAAAREFTVVHGDDLTVLLDLDGEEAIETFRDRLAFVAQCVDIGVIEEWSSKSGKGLHVKLGLASPATPTERALLQAVLGSDWKRETMALCQIRNGFDPHILFRPPTKPEAP